MYRPNVKLVNADGTAIEAPSSVEVEQMLLGILLVANAGYGRVATTLEADHFFDPFHQEIYRAIGFLVGRNREATPATLQPYLKDQYGEGDETRLENYLSYLAMRAGVGSDITYYAETIVDMYQRRVMIEVLSQGLDGAMTPDLDRSAAEVMAETMEALKNSGRSGPFEFKTARQVRIDYVEAMKTPQPAVSTGYARLDAIMGGGLYRGMCYGLAARKKAGKTTLAAQIAANAAGENSKVLYIAAEFGPTGIEQRRHASDMGINSIRFLTHDGDPQFITAAANTAIYATEDMIYCHAPGIYFDRLRRMLSQFVMTYPDATGFVLDYLQLVRGKERGEGQVEFGDRVAQYLADFCKEYNVFGVAVAQMNQEGNIRFGEGIRLSCDMCLELARTQEGAGEEAYVRMLESRYTPWRDAGSENSPSLILRKSHGPVFEEIPLNPADTGEPPPELPM